MISGVIAELATWARAQADSDAKLAELRAAIGGELRSQRRDEIAAIRAKYGIDASLADALRIAEVESADAYCSNCQGYDGCRYSGLRPAMRISGGLTYYVIECEARRRRIAATEQQRMYEAANLPREINEAVGQYALGLYNEERGVYLIGEGKTSVLTHIGRRRVRGGHSTLYISIPEVMGQLLPSASGSTELMTQVKTVDSLLMDDVGIGRAGEWATETMYVIMETRMRRGLWTSGAGVAMSEVRVKYGEVVGRRMERLMRQAEITCNL